mmetsp:Transcript_7302/g.11109  ORF Transcript_7302/g.11109 Transcript_7302/m.11109 type:complete len:96 (+) Transcript_7302:149-436(+)
MPMIVAHNNALVTGPNLLKEYRPLTILSLVLFAEQAHSLLFFLPESVIAITITVQSSYATLTGVKPASARPLLIMVVFTELNTKFTFERSVAQVT